MGALRNGLSALLLGAILAQPAPAAPAVHSVSGNTVISHRDPAVRLRIPKSARYVGKDSFILRDAKLGPFDACELFAFAQADGRRVEKLYWVQFESYLPRHPDIHHTYDSPRRARLGAKEFYVDTWTSSPSKKTEPGSDSAHFNRVLARAGLKRGEMVGVRLVHLTDATRRKELMIIYGEAVPHGYTVKSLKLGTEKQTWPQFERVLIRRAEKAVSVQFGG